MIHIILRMLKRLEVKQVALMDMRCMDCNKVLAKVETPNQERQQKSSLLCYSCALHRRELTSTNGENVTK